MTSDPPLRVLLTGATGTIGRATAAALLARGHTVICPVRPESRAEGLPDALPCDPTDPASLNAALGERRIDAIVSCLASRTGTKADAWAIDHAATLGAVEVAKEHGATRVVLLSAICVQRPRLAFQHAKRAAERGVRDSGLTYSIVRPTAYFKSLSGQIGRVAAGKPYLLFGDGRVTACTPISDRDLAAYLAECLTEPERENRVLPIGGPGPALTPLDMGEMLFELTGRPPRYRHLPLRAMDGIVAALGYGARLSPRLAPKAELARIGRYYATESMLVRDPETGRYDRAATPTTGTDRLRDFYARVLAGDETVERGDHAVF